MRHRRKLKKIGRPTDQRMALLKGLVTQIFLHGKIKTTDAKARAAKRMAEKTITIAREDTLAARRQVRTIVNDKEAFRKLFEEIAPACKDRNGGYLQIIKLPPRRGDATPMAVVKIVD